ncbi:MAG: hypothetical protein JO266_20590 [Acidobacteria bacterium]|nr:hypothetical protein [Acidobacteriota bacterium]
MIFFPSGLDPVLNGGVRDEDAVVTPEVPTGSAVGQAVFSNKTDSPLLNTAGVQAVGQSQVGDVTGEATAAAEAAMAGESDNQINGPVRAGIAEVMQSASGNGIAASAVTTARAGSRWPIATAPLDARLGQVFDPGDALGAIRNIFPWSTHWRLS